MAQDHVGQNTAPPAAAKPVGPAARWRVHQIRILALGLNAWVIAALWPALAGDPGWASWLPPAALLTGVALLGRPTPETDAGRPLSPNTGREWMADALLLGLFPALLALSIALRPAALNQRTLGPVPLLVLTLSMVIFGAAVAAAASSRQSPITADRSPLAEQNGGRAGSAGGRRRTALVVLVVLGAAAIAVVAPVAGGLPALEAAWGDAALEGGVLTAVVAAAIAITAVAAYLGDGLRSPRPALRAAGDREARVASLLFLALLGAVTYFVVID